MVQWITKKNLTTASTDTASSTTADSASSTTATSASSVVSDVCLVIGRGNNTQGPVQLSHASVSADSLKDCKRWIYQYELQSELLESNTDTAENTAADGFWSVPYATEGFLQDSIFYENEQADLAVGNSGANQVEGEDSGDIGDIEDRRHVLSGKLRAVVVERYWTIPDLATNIKVCATPLTAL